MAIAVLNPLIKSMHGRQGNAVFYYRLGKQCIRAHVIPRNPDTAAQRTVRRSFADAIKSWQKLSPVEKLRYNRKAEHINMSGYNLYISGYIKNRILVKVAAPAEQDMKAIRFASPPFQLRSCFIPAIDSPLKTYYTAYAGKNASTFTGS